MRSRRAVALCAAAAAGCAGAAETPGHLARDSAGVRIIESNRAEWTVASAWRVGETPVVRIGVVEGDPAYQFSGIAGAVRLEDGSIAVADAGSQQVRYFAADGRLLHAAGGAGAGPGEFTALSAIGTARTGALWTYDFALRRITRLDASGTLIGITTLGTEPPVIDAVGAMPDSSFVFRQLWGARAVAETSRTGRRRDPIAYVRFDGRGLLTDTIGMFPGREVLITEENGRGVMTTPLFGRNSVAALVGELVVVGSADRFQLDAYSAHGSWRLSMRIPHRDLSVGPGEIAAAIERRVASAPAHERLGLRASLEAQPAPAARPAYGALRADRAGNLWVAEWVASPMLPERWTVLAPDGRWLGDVRMPAQFHPEDIGDDWILGIERDSLDVESIVVYPLIKPTH